MAGSRAPVLVSPVPREIWVVPLCRHLWVAPVCNRLAMKVRTFATHATCGDGSWSPGWRQFAEPSFRFSLAMVGGIGTKGHEDEPLGRSRPARTRVRSQRRRGRPLSARTRACD